MNLEKELAVAKEAAVKAGYAIMDVYENAEDMQISYKDGDMPLTQQIKPQTVLLWMHLRRRFRSMRSCQRRKRMIFPVWTMIIVLWWIRWMERRSLLKETVSLQ